jgi:AraC-like DNA-binding protein
MARRNTGNHTAYWQHKRIPGMSLLRADFTTHEYGPHTHDAFVIAVTEAGGAEIKSRSTAAKVGPSTLFVSNPEERQSARMGESERWIYRAFYLTRPAIDAVAHQLGIEAAPNFLQNMIDDLEVIERFARLHRAFEAEHDDFCAGELVFDAFGMLFQRHGSGVVRPERTGQDRTTFNRIVELIQTRYAENLSLDDLARFAGLTNFQLIGLFKRTIGLTPHAYLIHVRLNAACRHLRRGYSLAESALAAGFCDQSALTKHFRRCYGITPLQFAEAVRAS